MVSVASLTSWALAVVESVTSSALVSVASEATLYPSFVGCVGDDVGAGVGDGFGGDGDAVGAGFGGVGDVVGAGDVGVRDDMRAGVGDAVGGVDDFVASSGMRR